MNQNNAGFMNSIPLVTRNLLIINVLVWLAQYLLGRNGSFVIEQYCALFPVDSGYFFPHQVITYMFLHDPSGPMHLFFNMFAVFMFGRVLETIWGPKKFLLYYLITGIGAGLTQLLVCHLSGSMNITVGASGAVFGILVAFGMIFPNAELMLLFPPIPIKAKWFVVGYGVLELVLGVAGRSMDNVAHFAHLGGLIMGLLILLYWRKKGFMTNGNIFR